MGVPKLLDAAQCETVRRLWAAGEPAYSIASALGVSMDTLRARLRDQLRDLPKRPRAATSSRRGEDPTPEEIRRRCEALRATWGPERYAETSPPERFGRYPSGHYQEISR
jgi:hypothetical protein